MVENPASREDSLAHLKEKVDMEKLMVRTQWDGSFVLSFVLF